VRVYASAWAALNGRPRQRLIDPDVDLMRVPRSLAPKSWIVPLNDMPTPPSTPPPSDDTPGDTPRG
jgi:vitamin K-dependent gamma-carboxylase